MRNCEMLGTHCMIMVLCSSVCYRMDKHLWVMLSDTISAFWPAHLGWKKYCKYNILKVLYCRYYMLTWVGGKREAWCWPVTGITNTGHQQSHCAWNPTNKQKRIWPTGCWHLIVFIEDLPKCITTSTKLDKGLDTCKAEAGNKVV